MWFIYVYINKKQSGGREKEPQQQSSPLHLLCVNLEAGSVVFGQRYFVSEVQVKGGIHCMKTNEA